MALLSAQTLFGAVSGIPCGYAGYTVFKGIPYASPPVGELRWKAPINPTPWSGAKVCDKFPAISVQAGNPSGSFYQKEYYPTQPQMSEDCLYLNVWTPAESVEANLPVMVWIHGGGYMLGYGHEISIDGEAFCKRGVILVTINYRLGAMGFFAHPELSKGNDKDVSGNYGILDQIHALKWVNQNIGAFGGDSKKVTVFGQSAGGGSVLSLCASPMTKGLIHKAIIMSAGGIGSTGPMGALTLADAEKYGASIVEHSGLPFEDFNKLSAEEILDKTMEYASSQSGGPFPRGLRPCTDGYVLPNDAGKVIENGQHLAIPYMTGWVAGDESFFGSHEEVRWISLKNGDNPLYVYRFNQDVPGDDNAGAFHGSELWYIFGTLMRCWRPMRGSDYEFSFRMTDYWTSFAKDGKPKSNDMVEWPEYTNENPNIQALHG